MLHHVHGTAHATAPRGLQPMLAVAAQRPPADEHAWAFELKLDGVRALYHAAGGTAMIRSRTGRDLTGCLPELAGLARVLDPVEVLLDGELIVPTPTDGPSSSRSCSGCGPAPQRWCADCA